MKPTREQIEEIANVVLKAAGSGGFRHYMPSTKERILKDLEEHLAATGRLNGLNLSNSTPLEITTDHDVRKALDALEDFIKNGCDARDCDKSDSIALIETIRAALQRPAVPEGYALVPIEPTLEMFQEGCSVHDACGVPAYHCERIYKAMLAAAPKQGVE